MKRNIWAYAVVLLLCIAAPISHAQVYINEISPHSTPEWVEFYNASDSAAYIGGYYIDDDTSFGTDEGNSPIKPLTALQTGNVKFPYVELATGIFNNTGDSAVLFDGSGAIADRYEYVKDSGQDVTIGRNPDGTGLFSVLTGSTKGSENVLPVTPSQTHTPTQTPAPRSSPTHTPTQTPVPPRPSSTPVPVIRDTVSSGVTAFSYSVTGRPSVSATPRLASESALMPPPEEGHITQPQYSVRRTVSGNMPYIQSLLIIALGFAILSGVTAYMKSIT